MSITLRDIIHEYFSNLSASLHTVTIDRENGTSVEFSRLFYPLQIDEGKYAFSHYQTQINRSEASSNQEDSAEKLFPQSQEASSAIYRSIREKLSLTQQIIGARAIPVVSSTGMPASGSYQPNSLMLKVKTYQQQHAVSDSLLQKHLHQTVNSDGAPSSPSQTNIHSDATAPFSSELTLRLKNLRHCSPEESHTLQMVKNSAEGPAVPAPDAAGSDQTAPEKEEESVLPVSIDAFPAIHKLLESRQMGDGVQSSSVDTSDPTVLKLYQLLRSEDSSSAGSHDLINAKGAASDPQALRATTESNASGADSPHSSQHETGRRLRMSGPVDGEKSAASISKKEHIPGASSAVRSAAVDEHAGASFVLPKEPTDDNETDHLHDESANLISVTPVIDEQLDYLFNEPNEKLRNRLYWFDPAQGASRVIALASAGCGKSSLLNRIALFFCHTYLPMNPDEISAEIDISHRYNLPFLSRENCFIPCMIRLRNVKVENFSSMDEIILGSMRDYLPKSIPADSIHEWLTVNSSRLLLLIDGLDELSDKARPVFLPLLSEYLTNHPTTGVIMSSRVSGLSGHGIRDQLISMSFHGRTIMPLGEQDILQYCRQWFDVTLENDPEQKATYLLLINEIQTRQKYSFLRDFMRKPLELTVILKQITKKTIAHNKWTMFRDMLWEQFSNHVATNRMQSVVVDTLCFLSTIAFYIQRRNSLSFQKDWLGDVLRQMQMQSFQTPEFIELTEESIWNKLEMLAANIGIVEKDDAPDQPAFFFPIRAYQEYLAAYACCHNDMNGIPGNSSAIDLIIPHIEDSYWSDVAEFAMLDMEFNHAYDLDEFKAALVANCTDLHLLLSLVENNVYLDLANAKTLCRKVFCTSVLSSEQKNLLLACLKSEFSYSFRKALLSLYQKTHDENPWIYLESLSLALLLWKRREGSDVMAYVKDLLDQPAAYKNSIAAGILILISRLILGEEPEIINTACDLNLADMLLHDDLHIDPELILALKQCAVSSRSALFVQAMAELWTARIPGSENIPAALDPALRGIVADQLRTLWNRSDLSLCSKQTYTFWLRYACIFTAFPLEETPSIPDLPILISTALSAMYTSAIYNRNMDRYALAVAQLYLGKSFGWFMNEWIWVLCKGIPSQSVLHISGSKRLQNSFALLQPRIQPYESDYRRITLNSFDPSEETILA